jgi:anti-anti-sigma factor|tara:strand:+ start:201 stop:503 length:303 start_codon:yes stop_codon:yes gene_type:complete
MKIKTPVEEHQTVVVLELEGEISQKAIFANQLRRLLEEGYRHFVIDLGKERKMDAAGVGALIVAWKAIHAEGGDMKLVPGGHSQKAVHWRRCRVRSSPIY